MHKHVEWDDPGRNSVLEHFANQPEQLDEPRPGDILSARYQGAIVRVKVEAWVDGTSIGEVAALIAADNGRRMKSHGKLALGDTVRLPDACRALEPEPSAPEDDRE
ncbi:hypothetical protein [Halomonas rhizosphaerae]|uniref:Uncharacterized protein n=1 Tax=Halomonas rhizosphaerae TaxID=3043296 RepID=A0ABT6UYT5_9GAMM|nr:hypothetical protein [Halomonas rhizosphaerae]MDI5891114.1 hypothetical protein [Halomonas rhizosphaerae]MDI5919505.1 hypothetical protein [Halomonas rhizosphaerae]